MIKKVTLLILCFVIVGIGAYNVTTTLPPPLVPYVTAEGDFDVVSVYVRGERMDYLQTEIFNSGDIEWFDNSLSNYHIFKVFVVVNGVSYGPIEINLMYDITTSKNEANVTIMIWEDPAPQGHVNSTAWFGITFAGVFGGIGLWILFMLIWEPIDRWKYRNRKRYGFEIRQDPGFRRPRSMPIKGRWWVRMINIKLGREKENVTADE